MTEYRRDTDTVHEITLDSTILTVYWGSRMVSMGESVYLTAETRFVGNGSDIEFNIYNHEGRKISTVKGKLFGDRVSLSYEMPDVTDRFLYFEATLASHGLSMKSDYIRVIPRVEVHNLKWSQTEARRGDVISMTADTSGIPDGVEMLARIFEYDDDGAHDLITNLPVTVNGGKIVVDWEYEYHDDTDDIPTNEDMQEHGRNYNPPEYFWVVEFAGRTFGESQESGLLQFKDAVDIQLVDSEGYAYPDEPYTILLADGSTVEGRTDDLGNIAHADIPPGAFEVEFDNYAEVRRQDA